MKRVRTVVALLFLFFPLLPVAATAERIGGGDILLKPESGNAGSVLYSHQKHVVDRGLKCSSCHYKIFQMARGSRMSMNSIRNGQLCGSCHNGQAAFDARITGNCAKCHDSSS